MAEKAILASTPSADSRQALSDLDRTIVRPSVPASPAKPVAAAAVPKAPPTPAQPPATLELSLQHHFAEANISVWVDNALAYTAVVRGEARKRLFVMKGAVQGRDSHQVQFPSGEHDIKVHIVSRADQYDESSTIHSLFRDKQRSVLEIRCNKHGLEMNLLNPS